MHLVPIRELAHCNTISLVVKSDLMTGLRLPVLYVMEPVPLPAVVIQVFLIEIGVMQFARVHRLLISRLLPSLSIDGGEGLLILIASVRIHGDRNL